MCMQPTATSQVQNANSNLVIDNSITYFMLLVLYVLLFIRRIVDWITDSKLIKCNSTLSLLVRVCLFNIFSISNRAPSVLNHRTHVYINDSLFAPIYCIILYGVWTEDLRRFICITIQSIQYLEIPKPNFNNIFKCFGTSKITQFSVSFNVQIKTNSTKKTETK